MGQKVSGFFLMVIILVGCSGCLSDPGLTKSPVTAPLSTHSYPPDYYAARLVSGGVAQDTIPALDNPVFESVSMADRYMNDTDIVFLVESEGDPRIYPRLIMIWHEIVNDVINNTPVAITYCPLTGSAIGYERTVSGNVTTFGTSGNLVNSNLVMYDRNTNSYWSQIPGLAITGRDIGTDIVLYPVIWTTWDRAKTHYPDAQVLSRDTGSVRSYGMDPYGSYDDPSGYYRSNGSIFPVLHSDPRLPDKEVVYGVRSGEKAVAIQRSYLQNISLIEFMLDDTPFVAWFDPRMDTIRVFSRELHGRELHFMVNGSEIRDTQTNTVWDYSGHGILGELHGSSLTPVYGFDLMWFGWAGFHPDTYLISETSSE